MPRSSRFAPLFAAIAATAFAGAACGEPPPSHQAPDAAPHAGARSAEPPPLLVGEDAYRHWDQWPTLRLGTRAFMRSTYDRTGGNETADAGHFLFQLADDFSVPLDVAGPGLLAFVRTNHWHGSPWHYVVDGHDTVVAESTTADPDHPVANSVFQPTALFPAPLALTWSTTQGADLSWVPIPFADTFRLGYGRTRYGTGYYIYDVFSFGAPGIPAPWDAVTPPGADVLALLAHAGDDLAPTGDGVSVHEGAVDVPAGGGAVTVAILGDGPATVRALRFTVAASDAPALARARLRITWDDRAAPSIDAPLGLFFGIGSVHDRAGRGHLVAALPVDVRVDPASGDESFATYFPMPYFVHARIELVSAPEGAAVPGVRFHARTVPYTGPSNWVGYLHATYVDHGAPTPGVDLVLLDTTSTEGGGDWCGSFVGTSFVFSDRADLGTLEGDPRFFFDDARAPQGYGTGTEEWGGGGDYWGGQTMTLALAGHPVGAPSAQAADSPEDQIESAYRFLLADLFPFGRNARIQLEHGGLDDSTEHYRTVTYWYGLPGACLVPTDSLHVGDLADEAAHGYVSPTASPVETITSRWELGVDHVGTTDVQPVTTDSGRHMTGTSEFSVALRPDNVGVLLRRELDYAWPNQRAQVFVADDSAGAPFEAAGTWYLAGSNTCVYSDPGSELGATAHTVQTSNRRFREDEFLLPRALTAGRARIRVQIVFEPMGIPLFPGAAAPAEAWSELRYTAYSYVMP